MYRVTLALLFTLLSVSSPANAWWNDSWNFRKEIVIDAAKLQPAVTEALEDVPILLRLHTGNFGYFFDVKEGGADLRVIAGDDQTPLKFDVEHWDPINELGYLWVRLPRLAAGGKASIYLYYGNPLAPAAAEPAAVSDDETLLR
ncbi:MAG: DUF2341 domain-containing protein, partial [Gammaproteobacteria bacterium]|nr:DUF2341 domain-containing protein [Gammaproteobacteria bacterium]